MTDVDGEGREPEQDDEHEARDDGDVAPLVALPTAQRPGHHSHPCVWGMGSKRSTADSSMVIELKTNFVNALCRVLR